MKRFLGAALTALIVTGTYAFPSPAKADDPKPELAADVQKFVKYGDPVTAITHVRVIDGTGIPARADQTVVIVHGKIAALGSAASVIPPAGATIVDGANKTLMPGLVGMHDHLFYIVGNPVAVHAMDYSFPRLYLAGGVTTIRTTGSVGTLHVGPGIARVHDRSALAARSHGDGQLLRGYRRHVVQGVRVCEPRVRRRGRIRSPAAARRVIRSRSPCWNSKWRSQRAAIRAR